MRKPNPQKTQQFDAKSQLLQQASEVEKFFKESEYAGEFSDDIIPATRAEVIPPPPPEKTRFNPDKIVDIITFIEHPYFCNLKPYPWQKLILKCFYMGQEGNTNLVINEKKEESGCNGCVWNYVKENEDLFYKTRKNSLVKKNKKKCFYPCKKDKKWEKMVNKKLKKIMKKEF